MSLVPSFAELPQPLSCVMTTPTFNSFPSVLTGWVFARRRTVTGMILAAEAVGTKHHSAYHRPFATARRSLDELGLAVFALILPPPNDASILPGIDDTPARKRGLKIFGVGMRHGPPLSTRKTAIMNWGHCRVVPGVVIKLPFCGDRFFCLPVLFRLYVPKKTAGKKGLACHAKPELAVQMVQLLCGGFNDRRFHAIGDSAYGGKSVLPNLPRNCDLTSRLTMDARLYDAPVTRKSRKGGRPRKRGVRLPTPEPMPKDRCRCLTPDVYGRRDKSRVGECVARRYAGPNRPPKIVAVEPPTGGRKPQAFFSTCPDDSAQTRPSRFAARWSIEVAYHDAKGHLGFEEPQGWTKRAVRRTAPVAMPLYTRVVLGFSRAGRRHYAPPDRPWYIGKTHASSADRLATLRCQSVEKQVLSMQLHGRGSRNVLKTLMHVVRQAA